MPPVAAPQPDPLAPHHTGWGERVARRPARRLDQEAFRWSAEQRAGRPAEHRVGRDEGEAAARVRLERDIGGQRHHVAPALPALQQHAAQWPGKPSGGTGAWRFLDGVQVVHRCSSLPEGARFDSRGAKESFLFS